MIPLFNWVNDLLRDVSNKEITLPSEPMSSVEWPIYSISNNMEMQKLYTLFRQRAEKIKLAKGEAQIKLWHELKTLRETFWNSINLSCPDAINYYGLGIRQNWIIVGYHKPEETDEESREDDSEESEDEEGESFVFLVNSKSNQPSGFDYRQSMN